MSNILSLEMCSGASLLNCIFWLYRKMLRVIGGVFPGGFELGSDYSELSIGMGVSTEKVHEVMVAFMASL